MTEKTPLPPLLDGLLMEELGPRLPAREMSEVRQLWARGMWLRFSLRDYLRTFPEGERLLRRVEGFNWVMVYPRPESVYGIDWKYMTLLELLTGDYLKSDRDWSKMRVMVESVVLGAPLRFDGFVLIQVKE